MPILENDNVTGVLDIDSKEMKTFDNTDREWLEKIARLIKVSS